VPCFAEGKSSGKHDPATHAYQVIEQHSIPIFTEDWGADEELLLLEGAETYGLGSWADIADHIGGFRNKDEVREHYINTYVNSPLFPLPERASPEDTTLSDEIPRDEFLARKKRRIETRKDAAKNAPPMDPKQKPTSSVPSCHVVQGFMPGRNEFETEYFNEAEEAVQHMQFEPGDGIDPRTGQLEPETELKMTVMDIYNHRLTARLQRKRVIFQHDLLEYRENAAIDKKRTKEERDLYNKMKPFGRMMNKEDFEAFTSGIESTSTTSEPPLRNFRNGVKCRYPISKAARDMSRTKHNVWLALRPLVLWIVLHYLLADHGPMQLRSHQLLLRLCSHQICLSTHLLE